MYTCLAGPTPVSVLIEGGHRDPPLRILASSFCVRFLFLLRSRNGNDACIIADSHKLDALCGAAVGADIGCRHADDGAVVGNDQDVVVIVDNLDVGYLAGFFGYIVILEAKAAAVLRLPFGALA